MGINAFHECVGVEFVDFGFDFMEAIVFPIGGRVVDRDHKANMTDVTLGLERARRIRGLVFSQAAEFLMREFIFIFAFGAAQERRGCFFKAV